MAWLSNNRGNASQLGLWCVNANNAPTNVNDNNWGARQSPQTRKMSRKSSNTLNQPPIQSASGLALTGSVGQSPLIRNGLVAPSEDGGRTGVMRKGRLAA